MFGNLQERGATATRSNCPNGYCRTRQTNTSVPLIPRVPTLTPDDAQKAGGKQLLLTPLTTVGADDSALFRVTNFHRVSPTSTSFSSPPRRWRWQWERKREITEETYQICFIISKCTVLQEPNLHNHTTTSLPTSQVVLSYSYPPIA